MSVPLQIAAATVSILSILFLIYCIGFAAGQGARDRGDT